MSEPETNALRRYLATGPFELVTNAIAHVEVHRAATIADARPDTRSRADELLRGCTVIELREPLLSRAAWLASQRVRTLDAIHLATAESVQPDAVLVYDERLAEAAREGSGLTVVQPGR